MATLTDSMARKAAENWINTVTKANQWRVQILSRRYRKDPATGKRKLVPLRIRRFAEGCPAAHMVDAIDVLLDMAPYTGVVFNGQVLSGKYRPTLTEWRRDDQTVVNGQQRTDGTYTLVQDLVEDGFPDEWGGPTTGSCTERVESLYVWDADTVVSLPEPTQGVTYAIQRVDKAEDGTFSYVLIKRTALTQLPPETQSADTEFDSTYVRTYRNLYGSPDTGFTDETGAAVAVPTPASAPAGTTIEWQPQVNDDCTYNVTVQRKEAKAATSETTTAENIEERSKSEVKRGQSAPLPEAPDAADGLLKTHKSELRPDGKYDTTEQTRQEQEVLDASVTVSVTRKGKRVTRVHKNQRTAASTTGLELGAEVKVEKTPGRRFNNSVSTWDRSEREKVGEKCETDLYSHTDETTESGATMPTGHVSGGGVGGHVVKRSTTVDEDGAVIQTVTDKLEKPVPQSMRRWATTIRGTTYEERNTNQPSAPAYVEAVGRTLTVEKTEGGLYNYTIKQFSKAVAGSLGMECSKTIFEHVHRTITSEESPYSGVGHVPGASGGKSTTVTSRRNEDGGYDQTVTEKIEQAVPSASVEKAVTLKGTRVTTVNRNMPSAAPGSGKIGSSVRNERTDGGLYNQTITETDVHDLGLTREDCVSSASEHRHSETNNVTTKPSAEVGSPAVGTIVEKSVAATELSTFDVTTTTRTARQLSHSVDFGSVLLKSTSVAYRNARTVAVAPGGVNVETRASLTKNDFQLLDGTVTTTTHYPTTLGPLASGNVDTRVETTFGRNVTSVSGAVGATNVEVALTASANDHGSYDYTLRKTTYMPYGPAVIGTATSTLKTVEIRYAKNSAAAPSVTGGVNTEVSISASRNDHGSFDWTSRKETYNPYGPTTIATATGTFKTTTITAAYNQTSVASQAAGQNEEISISASMNSHGSFDWTARKDHYNPYGPVTIATATGTFKTTTITAAYNQTSVAAQSAGTNEEISISASMNSHGSFDWTARKDKYSPYGPTTIATATGTFKTTTITAAYNQTSVASQTAGTNEEISISASMNSHGSFDWTSRKDTYQPYGPQMVAQTSSPVVTTSHYVGLNQQSVSSSAGGNQKSTISVSMNQHGTLDYHEVVQTPSPLSMEASWTGGSGNRLKTYNMIVYRNQSQPLTKSGSYSASASASINDFGLCDGSAVGVDGNTDDSGGGDKFAGGGGTVEHYITFQTPGGKHWKQRVTLDVERMIDRPSNVIQFIAGGTSFGPFRSGIEGSAGRDTDGTPLVIGAKYTNINFDAPEVA